MVAFRLWARAAPTAVDLARERATLFNMAEDETLSTIERATDDNDPIETAEWLASMEAVHRQRGLRRTEFLLQQLHQWALKRQVPIPFAGNTPYINTIPRAEQPPYPGDRQIERRIKSFVR